MNRFIVAGLVAATLTVPASADLIRVDFTGQLSGNNPNNAFGTPVPTVTGSFTYETDTAGTPFTSTQTRYNNAIKSFSFNLGSGIGGSYASDAGFGRAQVANLAGADSISFGNFAFGPSVVTGEPADTNSVSFTLRFAGPTSAFGTEALTQLPILDPDLLDNQQNMQLFVSRSANPSGTQVSFNYNFSDITVTNLDAPADVPAPPALALVGLGIAGLAGLRRRKA